MDEQERPHVPVQMFDRVRAGQVVRAGDLYEVLAHAVNQALDLVGQYLVGDLAIDRAVKESCWVGEMRVLLLPLERRRRETGRRTGC